MTFRPQTVGLDRGTVGLVRELRLCVPGRPQPKQRPRVVAGGRRTYTPAATRDATVRWVEAWIAAGRPQLGPDVQIMADVTIVHPRPEGHLLADGETLSAAGMRANPWPPQDLDNLAKLPLDALNGRAWGDDAQIVDLSATKRWSRLDVDGDHSGGVELRAWVTA